MATVASSPSPQTQTQTQPQPRPILRRAADFRIEQPHQTGQAHRSAAGAIVDYRLQEVTDSAARAICTVPGNFADKPRFASPWHFHDCDLQVAIILDGSVELGYRAGEYARAQAGDILFIPGKVMHDVGAPSADYQIAEITFPGGFGTVEAPMPAPGVDTPARTLGPRDAVRVGTKDGITEYAFTLAAPYSERYAICRFLRSRTEAFAPATHRHQDRYRALIPVQGWKEIDLGDGRGTRVERADLLVVPPDVDCRDLAASDDYAAIEVRLLHG